MSQNLSTQLSKLFPFVPSSLIDEIISFYQRDKSEILSLLQAIKSEDAGGKFIPLLLAKAGNPTACLPMLFSYLRAYRYSSISYPQVKLSQVTLYPEEVDNSTCGYCHANKKGRKTYGFVTNGVLPSDYQGLMDRGFRRSGTYVYRPNNMKTCCPCYTIRLDVLQFKMSKNQRNVWNRFQRYLDGEDWNVKSQDVVISDAVVTPKLPIFDSLTDAMKNICKEIGVDCDDKVVSSRKNNTGYMSAVTLKLGGNSLSKAQEIARKMQTLGFACDVVKPGFINFESKDQISEEKDSKEKTVVATVQKSPKRGFTVTTVPAMFDKEAFEVYKKYQIVIHKDKPEKLKPEQYSNFLCNSPIDDGPCGSFHQHYRIDGKLVAVGVIDILPFAVSGVYFFYDPDYSFLSLGVLSALYEIKHIQELAKTHADLHYYYMGYYIHSCPKMRYKGEYYPSELLCSERYTWFPIESCQKLLDARAYVSFSDHLDPNAKPKENEEDFTRWLSKLQVHSASSLIKVSFEKLSKAIQAKLKGTALTFVSLIGSNLASRFEVNV